MLTCTLTAMAEPSQADQKWLGAVEKMVAKGESTVSTPSQDRVKLVQDWAAKRGYSAQVTKTDAGYRIVLTKSLAQN